MSKNKDNLGEIPEPNLDANDEISPDHESGGVLSYLSNKMGAGYILFGILLLLIVILGGRHKILALMSSDKAVKTPAVVAKVAQPNKKIFNDSSGEEPLVVVKTNPPSVAPTDSAPSIPAAAVKTDQPDAQAPGTPPAVNAPTSNAVVATSAQPNATNGLSPDAIKDIVKDFIMNNPNVIMESVTQYQQKMMEQRAQDSKEYISKSADKIVANKPYLGNAKGSLVITEFFDYRCGHCKKVHADLGRLIKEYPNLKLALVELPFLGPVSVKAVKFSLAVNALYPEKFADFHAALLNASSIDDNVISGLIAQYGMDKAKLLEKANSDAIDGVIRENMQQATNAGVQGVPSFIIGGEFFTGASTYDELKKKIDATNKKS